MSYAPLLRVKELEQTVRALMSLVEQLARDAAEILSQSAVREQLRAQGLSDATQKPAEFAAHIQQETRTWARIIRARGITAE